MATTAAISLGLSSAITGQPVPVALTVSNSGGAAIQVVSIQPLLFNAGTQVDAVAGYYGLYPQGPNQPNSVPAGGTLVLNTNCVFLAPRQTGTSAAYDIGAIVTCSDGSVAKATVGNVTINGAGH